MARWPPRTNSAPEVTTRIRLARLTAPAPPPASAPRARARPPRPRPRAGPPSPPRPRPPPRRRRCVTPSRTLAPAPSQTFSPSVMPARVPLLLDHGHARLVELVAAADQVGVGGEEAVAADRHLRAGEDLGVEADVDVVAERDVAVLAGEDGAAAEEDAVAQRGCPGSSCPWRRARRGRPPPRRRRGGSCAGWRSTTPWPKVTLRPDRAEQPGVGEPAQDEAQGARHPGRGQDDRPRRGGAGRGCGCPRRGPGIWRGRRTSGSLRADLDRDGLGLPQGFRFRRRTVSCAVFGTCTTASDRPTRRGEREDGAAPDPAGRTRGHAGHRRAASVGCGSNPGTPPTPSPSPSPSAVQPGGPVAGAYTLQITPSASCAMSRAGLSLPDDRRHRRREPRTPACRCCSIRTASRMELEALSTRTSRSAAAWARTKTGSVSDQGIAGLGARDRRRARSSAPPNGHGEVVTGTLAGYLALAADGRLRGLARDLLRHRPRVHPAGRDEAPSRGAQPLLAVVLGRRASRPRPCWPRRRTPSTSGPARPSRPASPRRSTPSRAPPACAVVAHDGRSGSAAGRRPRGRRRPRDDAAPRRRRGGRWPAPWTSDRCPGSSSCPRARRRVRSPRFATGPVAVLGGRAGREARAVAGRGARTASRSRAMPPPCARARHALVPRSLAGAGERRPSERAPAGGHRGPRSPARPAPSRPRAGCSRSWPETAGAGPSAAASIRCPRRRCARRARPAPPATRAASYAQAVVDWWLPQCSLARNRYNDPEEVLGPPDAVNLGGRGQLSRAS